MKVDASSGAGSIVASRTASGGVQLGVPDVPGHPNRVPFAGVLTLVDVPSEKAPAGARGHRVVLRRVAAEAALPSLMGMAVDFTAQWDGHDARAKCGILTHAAIEGCQLKVRGYLFARDYPEVELGIDEHGEGAMGMSYELADAQVTDMRASVWQLERVMFTGAAILLRAKAAYGGTSFQLLDENGGPRRKPVRRRPGVFVAAGTGPGDALMAGVDVTGYVESNFMEERWKR